MKPISWSSEKNTLLKAERGISFEDVVYHIMAENILETIDHPNQDRYPGQKVHLVVIEEYVYLVPFVESEDEVFLKTIIPSVMNQKFAYKIFQWRPKFHQLILTR